MAGARLLGCPECHPPHEIPVTATELMEECPQCTMSNLGTLGNPPDQILLPQAVNVLEQGPCRARKAEQGMAPVPLLTPRVGWGLSTAASLSPGAVPALQDAEVVALAALQGHQHLSHVPDNECLQARACASLFPALALLRGDSRDTAASFPPSPTPAQPSPDHPVPQTTVLAG